MSINSIVVSVVVRQSNFCAIMSTNAITQSTNQIHPTKIPWNSNFSVHKFTRPSFWDYSTYAYTKANLIMVIWYQLGFWQVIAELQLVRDNLYLFMQEPTESTERNNDVINFYISYMYFHRSRSGHKNHKKFVPIKNFPLDLQTVLHVTCMSIYAVKTYIYTHE